MLTPAEWTVVNLARHGLTDRTIARLRRVSRDAIKFHITNAREKLGLRTKASLRLWRGIPKESAMTQQSQLSTGSELQLGAIGQIARAVKDFSRAEAWYRDVLGLPHMYTYGKLAFFDCSGVRLMIEDRSIGEVPNLHNDSVLYFRVPDIQAAYDTLRTRSVEFLGAPHMIAKHPDGTEEWMAFFKDCDGGLLAIMSQVKPG